MLNLKNPSAPAQSGPGGIALKKKGRRKGWVKKLVAVVLVCAIAGGGAWYFLGGDQNTAAAADNTYTTAEVTRQTITSTITGSGTLEAADSYSVTTLLEGTILTADFEEGDQVEEGTVLYTIDSSDASSSLEQSQISVNQAQRNYNNAVENLDDLTVTAPVSGRILSLDVEVGDDVAAGQTVATIRNSDVMELTVPFPADDAQGFYVGQAASVTLDSTFEILTGTVSEIAANTEVLTGNMIVRQITIQVDNPGGITTTQSASAEINGVGSSSGGTFTYADESTVVADVAGTVAAISISEGDWVDKNQTLLTLTSETLSDQVQSASESLRNAEISYDKQTEQLDDYTITAPITGTIVDKYYNAGEISEANQVMCTIYDLSYLTMTLSVDELDISDIAVGQTVSVTADAVEGQTYTGVVTKVSVAGTSTGSATTYPVTIRIDETDGLLPGMSVDATIELESAENVLAIPTAALNRGNTVLVTADSPSAVNAVTQTPEDTEGIEAPEGTGELPADLPSNSGTDEQYVSIPVTVGISDDNYIEITSGLQEGDVVAYIPTTSSNSGMAMMMGGMPGGMSGAMGGGGGMPSGGRPGGM
ncbi:HlyD family efflux transporter periplasmic adaptor subunit [uncultured Intestinimonas sp.]|uniref:HlyD family efflux transporter periplasmic adaptor subunit n=1 Tax=uncultured Intestinimonas sp. TaxID=1689265 RepID=UPI0025FBAED8|nr:HlyD family efflux transporter periplasmic adaptor subunit [uncultured Intestinimonas sp.]